MGPMDLVVGLIGDALADQSPLTSHDDFDAFPLITDLLITNNFRATTRHADRLAAFFATWGLTIEYNRGDIGNQRMPDEKRGPARITLPPRSKVPEVVEPIVVPEGVPVHTSEKLIARMPPGRREPWAGPLAGLGPSLFLALLLFPRLCSFS